MEASNYHNMATMAAAATVGSGPPKSLEMERESGLVRAGGAGSFRGGGNTMMYNDPIKIEGATEACRTHLELADTLDVRQTRRGCCQEILGCEARAEFKYLHKGNQIAYSLEDSDCCCRICCGSIHPFSMRVNELGTDAELLTVERPCACSAAGCKCCCYQTAKYSSGGNALGSIKETCYFCVPSFKIYDAAGTQMYLLHPPTCCCGVCIHCCTEGNPCFGSGCCKVPFWIFDASAKRTNGGKVEHMGKILKKPKSTAVELFSDASAFEVHFPAASTVEQKAVLVGTAIFLNAVFFEGGE